MNHHLAQNINLPLALRSEIVNTGGLVADPFTGAVNDTVLLFAAVGAITGPAAYITEINEANNGTSVTLQKAGVYEVKLYLQEVASQTVVIGISQDVAAAGLNSDPSFAIAGFLDVQSGTTGVGQVQPMSLTTTIIVRPEDEVAGTVIRFHASDGANGAPAGSFTQAAAYYRIRRVNQAHE